MRKIKIFLLIVLFLLFFFDSQSKNHKDLKGLRLICDSINTKYGFEFIDSTFFSEYIYNKNDGLIENKGKDFHYLSDESYVYLERVDLANQLYVRINRSTLLLNDNKEMKCMILKTPILEFFNNLKKQQFN